MWCDAFRASPSEAWQRWDAAFRAANTAVPGTAAGAEAVLESPELQKLMATACDPKKLAAFSDAAAKVLASRPSTLIHGDALGDNLFRKDGTDDVRCSSHIRLLLCLDHRCGAFQLVPPPWGVHICTAAPGANTVLI